MSVNRSLSRLINYSKKHRSAVWSASAYSVLNKIFDLAPPLLIGASVDVVVRKETSMLASFGFESIESQLIVLAVATLIIWGLESLFEYLYQIAWRGLAQRIQHEIRMDCFSHLQDLDIEFFENKSTGGLMAILNDDVNQLERFLDKGANDILQVLTTCIMVGGVFFYLSPVVAAFSMLPIPIILWGSFRYQDKLAPRYAKVRERVSILNSDLSNVISGIQSVKSYTASRGEIEKLDEESRRYIEANQKAIVLSSAFSPLIRMVVVIGFLTTLVLGGFLASKGELEVGAFSVLVFITQRLLWPLTRLGETFDLYQRAMASVDRLLNLLAEPIKVLDGPIKGDKNHLRGNIEFHDVGFHYSNGFRVFDRLNLNIRSGETVGIVGSTGAGKSTLLKLLLRFYDVTSGEIFVDGKNLKEFSLNSLRQDIALVSQDVFLFHGSVLDNIRYGKMNASMNEVLNAAKLAEADEFVGELPSQYDTVVGERGQKLSGGQRQRVSLARAILKDAPILVLDEATSSVDNETEAAIQRSLAKVAKDRTTIIVAHRLSTIKNADRIFVIENGRVAEVGTHSELIDNRSSYAALWNVQTGSQVI